MVAVNEQPLKKKKNFQKDFLSFFFKKKKKHLT